MSEVEMTRYNNKGSIGCDLISKDGFANSKTASYPLIALNNPFFFLVVDISLAYNTIIGQVIDRFQTAISTYHLYLKFPTLVE
ncbi:hypothetical protein ACLOJK_000780 [Asimina triloba]